MLDYNKIKVGIIDLGINNLFSLVNCLREIGYKVRIVKNNIKPYDFVFLPGVGSFHEGMKSLKKKNFDQLLFEEVSFKNKKIIGICLGKQLLFEKSFEFGEHNGLGLVPGFVKKFSAKHRLPVVGWYKTKSKNKTINNKFLYHTHSFYCKPKINKMILSTTKYNNINYCSSVLYKNILAFQFHPEKSGYDGIKLLKYFPNFF